MQGMTTESRWDDQLYKCQPLVQQHLQQHSYVYYMYGLQPSKKEHTTMPQDKRCMEDETTCKSSARFLSILLHKASQLAAGPRLVLV